MLESEQKVGLIVTLVPLIGTIIVLCIKGLLE